MYVSQIYSTKLVLSGENDSTVYTSIEGDFKTQSSEMCVASGEKGRDVVISSVQQTDGSSTAAAPSVTALTHFAIVWEALLMESEDRTKQHRL